MEFSVNHPILYILAGLIVAVVLGQSVYFLLKALKRSRQIGMDQAKIRKTIRTAAIITIIIWNKTPTTTIAAKFETQKMVEHMRLKLMTSSMPLKRSNQLS